MHYSCICIIPGDGDPAKHVEELMAPYDEQAQKGVWNEAEEDYDYPDGYNGWWDWWQIGGRWTGHLVEGYDPEKDPRNLKFCTYCNGTGTRTDMVVEHGCNVCRGTGQEVEWPTQWVKFEGDVLPTEVAAESPTLSCATLVTPDGYEHSPGHWRSPSQFDDPEAEYAKWVDKLRGVLRRLPGLRVVMVDYHS